ncbi:X-box-binding protein 1-like [Limulus polyphemus]|uniref:X-box-binding protein 1 n=1 Tax=Limulus polyphemus TaxID=6850 RepID=A0ABM1C4Y9_LIMPO|nr:X-box-binding protein 1-like [Limulus polyphemus]
MHNLKTIVISRVADQQFETNSTLCVLRNENEAKVATVIGGGVISGDLGVKLCSLDNQDMSFMRTDDNINKSGNMRKRQRLDHLTLIEKNKRRKLKNRIAAQSARDRRKAQLEELEKEVSCLEKEKKALHDVNEALCRRVLMMEEENSKLKLQLRSTDSNTELRNSQPQASIQDQEDTFHQPQVNSETHKTLSREQNSSIMDEENGCKSFEHALLINEPLQKGQDLLHFLLMIQLTYLQMLIMSVMDYTSSLKSATKISSLTTELHRETKQQIGSPENQCMKWWGPQQNSWNPSKNL